MPKIKKIIYFINKFLFSLLATESAKYKFACCLTFDIFLSDKNKYLIIIFINKYNYNK